MSDYEPRIKTSGIPKDRAKRFNTGKIRPSLMPVEFTEEIIKVLEEGAKKYGDNNWQKGLPFRECLDSLERHLIDFKKGVDVDPDDGQSTIAKVAVNALFLRFFQLKEMEDFDDR